MKTNKTILMMKSSITVLILLISMSIQAADNVKVIKNNNTSIVIEATETMKGDEIIIRNQKGNVLYSEQLGANKTYEKIFQFSLFDNGVYIVSFENNFKVEYYNVIKDDNGIQLLNINNGHLSFKPIVKRDHDLAHVFLTNKSLENVELRIVDQSGEELTTTRFNDELIIKRSYDLSRLPSGKYSLIIEIGNQTFTKALNLQ